MHYLGTVDNPGTFVVEALEQRLNARLREWRSNLKKHLDKFITRIDEGEFGPFDSLWSRAGPCIQALLRSRRGSAEWSINQIVDDVDSDGIANPWTSKLLAAVVTEIFMYGFRIDGVSLSYSLPFPAVQLAVSFVCYSMLSRYSAADIV